MNRMIGITVLVLTVVGVLAAPPAEPVVAYFAAAVCPPGWMPYAPAGGRFIIPVDGRTSVAGVAVGPAFDDMDDGTHNHSLRVPFNIVDEGDGSIPGIGTSYLDGGDYAVTGQLAVDSSKTGLPLMQVITCTLSDNTAQYAFPVGGFAFFDSAATSTCPSSWQTNTFFPYGYALMPNSQVVLDKQARPLVAGQPILHSHVSTSIHVGKPGIADFCGSTLGNTGPSDSNQIPLLSGNSTFSQSLPYLSLLTCEKVFNTTSDAPSPPGLLVFSPDCSSLDPQLPAPSWVPYPKFDGRFLVSSPVGGNPAGMFGTGFPQPAGASNTYSNMHHHNLNLDNPIQGRCALFETVNVCGACVVGGFQCNMHQPACGNLQVQGGVVGSGAWAPPFVQLQLCIKMQ